MTGAQERFLVRLFEHELSGQTPLIAGAYQGAPLNQVRVAVRNRFIQAAEIGDPVILTTSGRMLAARLSSASAVDGSLSDRSA